jgi:toxin ParE1/3/4
VTRRIVVERAAEQDLIEATLYLRERSPDTARRFVPAARQTFVFLAAQPDIGRLYDASHPRLQDLRVWRIRGFDQYLLFYRATEETLFIVRVLYGTRDIEGILTN